MIAYLLVVFSNAYNFVAFNEYDALIYSRVLLAFIARFKTILVVFFA